jgi:hypothetical protein
MSKRTLCYFTSSIRSIANRTSRRSYASRPSPSLSCSLSERSASNPRPSDVLGLTHGSQLGESLAFFLYDVPKVLLLLSGMIFLISIVRAFVSPERTRALLGGQRQGVGNVE